MVGSGLPDYDNALLKTEGFSPKKERSFFNECDFIRNIPTMYLAEWTICGGEAAFTRMAVD